MAADHFLLAGIMGDPVAHSRSPAIHNGWLAERGIEGRYVKLHIKTDGLARALRALPALAFRGVNLTIPHKEAALGIVDHVDPAARRIGAINLVTVGGDGHLTGRNTDGPGWLASIYEAAPDWSPAQAPATVLGAGGGARAVIVTLLDAGAREIRLCNRTDDRAQALADEFGPLVRPVLWRDRTAALAGAGLLVNTTSQGMSGQPPLDLDLHDLPATALVNDIVYVPIETPLLSAARQRGNRAIDGLGMLLHQAVPSFEAFFGVRPQVTRELRDRVAASL